MFNISDIDLQRGILGCSDGPASFNAILTRRGGHVVSVDPVYQFTADQIRDQIDKVYPNILAQMEENAGSYNWDSIESVENLGRVRMHAMQEFLSDFETGFKSGRYIFASLPTLPFCSQQFELALCSHFLFLYSDQVSLGQHVAGMKELCRVACEVRVYPLISLDGTHSKHLPAVIEALTATGIQVSLESVGYRFQRGAAEMLVAKSVASQ